MKTFHIGAETHFAIEGLWGSVVEVRVDPPDASCMFLAGPHYPLRGRVTLPFATVIYFHENVTLTFDEDDWICEGGNTTCWRFARAVVETAGEVEALKARIRVLEDWLIAVGENPAGEPPAPGYPRELEWSDRNPMVRSDKELIDTLVSCLLDHPYDRRDGIPGGLTDAERVAVHLVITKHASAVNPDWRYCALHMTHAQQEALRCDLEGELRKVWERT